MNLVVVALSAAAFGGIVTASLCEWLWRYRERYLREQKDRAAALEALDGLDRYERQARQLEEQALKFELQGYLSTSANLRQRAAEIRVKRERFL